MDTRARRAVDAEAKRAGELSSFLNDWPDIVREKYLLLLEHALEHHPDNDALFNAIFQCIRDSQYFHSTAPKLDDGRWSIQELRQDRGTWHKTKPRISYYDIFVASIDRWIPEDESRTNPIYNCPVITKKILDHARDELWREGAIHACAEHGLSLLLLYILNEVMPTDDETVTQQLQIAFLSGPDAEATSLGVAITRQIGFLSGPNSEATSLATRRDHLDCIRGLLGMRPQAGDYVAQDKNLLMDDSSERPILHTTLKLAKEAIGMDPKRRQSLDTHLDRLESLLRAITRAHRGLLTHRDKNGTPPYRYAVPVQSSFGSSRIEDFLRTEIFELGDPKQVARALYSKDGALKS
jgi:hypothetical protein